MLITPPTQEAGWSRGIACSKQVQATEWDYGGPQMWAYSSLTKVREFELILALSKLLTTGVATNKRSWPRMWLISILSIEVGPFHLDQGWRIQIFSLYHISEGYCLPPHFWGSVFTEWPSWCCSVFLSFYFSFICFFCLIILILTFLLWNMRMMWECHISICWFHWLK